MTPKRDYFDRVDEAYQRRKEEPMTMNHETRATRLTVAPKGEPIFSEKATHIELDDEAAGEFVVIEQCREDAKPGRVSFDFDEWPHIVAAVDRLRKESRP